MSTNTSLDGGKIVGESLRPVAVMPSSDSTQAAFKAAAKILEDLQKDTPVPERTVIRWTSVHPVNGAEFHYAAVFAGGAWFTSAQADNSNVQRVMQHEDLVAYLNKKKANLKNIELAVDFVSLNW